MTDVRGIIINFLKANGYDGLVNLEAECGCGLDELNLCDGPCVDCEPAYRWATCDGCKALEGEDGFCEWEGLGCYRTVKQEARA